MRHIYIVKTGYASVSNAQKQYVVNIIVMLTSQGFDIKSNTIVQS